MRSFIRGSLVTLLLVAIAAPLVAQDIGASSSGHERTGFWWGFGLGAVKADVRCPACPDVGAETFPMFDIHFGTTLSRTFTLGIQIAGGQKTGAFNNSSAATSSVRDVNASAYFYPKAAGNLWLQGGLAGVLYRETLGSTTRSAFGAGLVLGAGYDFRFGRNASITPSLRGVLGGKGDKKDQDGNTIVTDFQTSYIHAGVSIIWH